MNQNKNGLLAPLLVVSLIIMLMVPQIPVGYASDSYSAETNNVNNSLTPSYGKISFIGGGNEYPLNDVLKTPFTTVRNNESIISAQYRSGAHYQIK